MRAYMLPLNMVMPAVNRPAASGLSRAIRTATEWTSLWIILAWFFPLSHKVPSFLFFVRRINVPGNEQP